LISSYASFLFFRDREKKRRSPVNRPFGPDPATVTVDDAPHIGQSDADALEIPLWVQAMKHAEQPLGEFHVKSNAVVANKHGDLVLRLVRPNFDPGLLSRACVFQGVGKKIDQDPPEHERIALDFRQTANLPVHLAPRGLL